MNTEESIAELKSKIEIETKVKNGAEYMLSKITDKAQILTCKETVKESEKRISFLKNELSKLQGISIPEDTVKPSPTPQKKHSKYNIMRLLRSKSESQLPNSGERNATSAFSNLFVTRLPS
jgi:hypothetical protein